MYGRPKDSYLVPPSGSVTMRVAWAQGYHGVQVPVASCLLPPACCLPPVASTLAAACFFATLLPFLWLPSFVCLRV